MKESNNDDSNFSGSLQYVMSVQEKTTNVKVNVPYTTTTALAPSVKGYLTSPDGSVYEMKKEDTTEIEGVDENSPSMVEGNLYYEASEMMAGKWTINILPNEITVAEITTESIAQEMGVTAEEFEFNLSTDTYIMFYCDYQGNGEIWGTVEDTTGNTYNLEDKDDVETDDEESEYNNRNNEVYRIGYTIPYVTEGRYKVTIYHKADTKIKEVNFSYDEQTSTQEIITIEE